MTGQRAGAGEAAVGGRAADGVQKPGRGDAPSLNPVQLEAASCIHGPVAVVSCAGSGKTTVILERARRIIASGVPPHRVLTVTFSRAAARELEGRYARRFDGAVPRFSTIHSLCYSVLAASRGLGKESILTEQEKRSFFLRQQQAAMEAGERMACRDFDEFYRDILSYIGKRMAEGPERAEGRPQKRISCEERLFQTYTCWKRRQEKVDFDDMILLCRQSFMENQELLARWQGIFDFIMIDEFQDTSLIQAEIFYLLAKPHGNLCVVGDDDQSIYGFRGADSRIFQSFFHAFPGCRRFVMDTNYRSLPGITEAACRLILHNKHRIPKELTAARTGKAELEIRPCSGEEAQIDWILERIRACRERGEAYRDTAVLYRVKREAAALVDRLILEGIPFYTREMPEELHRGLAAQDVLAYYRLSHSIPQPGDLVRILNRPKRYLKNAWVRGCPLDKYALYQACTREAVGAGEYDRINDTINNFFLDLRNLRSCAPADFFAYLELEMGYRDSLQEYAEYRKLDGERLERDFLALKNEARLFSSMEEWAAFAQEPGKGVRCDPEGVCLSTFHGAKGLEWKNVYILSANEGVTPCATGRGGSGQNSTGRSVDLEEERRLFYVAVTRAAERLGISWLKLGTGHPPSRFLKELEGA